MTAAIQLPQADRLSLVVAFLEAVAAGLQGVAALSQELSISPRQVNYYAHAACFLGLLSEDERRFTLTNLGKTLLDTNPDERFEQLVRLALEVPALQMLLAPLATLSEIDQDAITKRIEEVAGYGNATAQRRAQTIWGWFRQANLDLKQSIQANAPIRDQLSFFGTNPTPKPKAKPSETAREKTQETLPLFAPPEPKHAETTPALALPTSKPRASFQERLARLRQTQSRSLRRIAPIAPEPRHTPPNFVVAHPAVALSRTPTTLVSPVPKADERTNTEAHSTARRRAGSVFLGVALRTFVEPGKASILCRMVLGASPAAQFFELGSTKDILDAIVEEELAVVAVAAPLWLPGEGLQQISAREADDPEMWVARPWTRSTFVAALGFARVELEGSAPGLAARGRFLRESLAKHGIVPSMSPATPEDDGPRLIEVHTGLSLKALRGTDKRQENIPDGRRVRRAVEAEAGEVLLPPQPDQRHVEALTAAWTALKFSQGAAWCPQGSSVADGFVVIPFLA